MPGVAYVPEGRGIFPHLTVIDNLRAMLRAAVPPSERGAALDRALETFPVLQERRRQAAGTLSGGEQQMLALARVLAAPPRSARRRRDVAGSRARAWSTSCSTACDAPKADGVTIVLVEQYVERALAFADDAIVMRQGEVAWRGPAAAARDEVVAGYLGS